jgi:hypothetical protein
VRGLQGVRRVAGNIYGTCFYVELSSCGNDARRNFASTTISAKELMGQMGTNRLAMSKRLIKVGGGRDISLT